RFGGGVSAYYPAQISLGGRARIYDNYNNQGVEENVSFDTSGHNALNSTTCITIIERILPDESAPGNNDGFWVGVTRDTNN
ncbi:hypothetical protein, partial [Salmonella enterica]|uniref:hypothetical protein n=1 Tax=Salmonella enterica TaxID=28901 RepID=UPI0032978639